MKRAILVFGLLIALTCGIVSTASAEYLGWVSVKRLKTNGNLVEFGVSSGGGTNTCSFYAMQFKFDATTASGKVVLSILLAAKSSGKLIDIWYGASPTPGKNENDGCAPANLSPVYDIGFSDTN